MITVSNKKNFVLSLLSSFGGQVITIIIGFISVPISLSYWGQEKFGIYSIFSSIITYLSVSNLGLNSATAVLMGKNSKESDKTQILYKSIIILTISLVLFCTFFILVNLHGKNWIFFIGNIPKSYFNETYNAIVVLVIFFFINSVFSLIDAGFTGFYLLHIQKNFETVNTILMFMSLVFTVLFDGSLVTFMFISGILKFVLNVIKIFIFYKKTGINFNFRKIEKKNTNKEATFRFIFSSGLRYFIVGIASMFILNTDNLIISKYLGISSVASYAVTFKLFTIFFSMIYLLTYSIMPIISKEISCNNWDWINKVYGIYMKVMIITGGIIWVGGILFSKDFIYIWTGKSGFAGLWVVIFLGAYSFILSINSFNFGILQSFNFVNEAVWITCLEAIIKFSISILLIKKIGPMGLALGTFLGALFGSYFFLIHSLTKKTANRIKFDSEFIINYLIKIVFPLVLLSILIQKYIYNIPLRLTLGIIVVIIYFILTWKKLPEEIKKLVQLNKKIKFWRL